MSTTTSAGPAADRLSLASDLQDLIGHRVAAMEVQTAAARRLLDESPRAAAESLAVVLRLGDEAMGELRRLGRLLDEGAPAALHPTPTLASIEAITGDAVDVGDVEVPGGVALCAVRVVELLIGRDPTSGVAVRLRARVLRIESAWAPGAEDEERLRVLARPCDGRVTHPGRGWLRVDLPLAS